MKETALRLIRAFRSASGDPRGAAAASPPGDQAAEPVAPVPADSPPAVTVNAFLRFERRAPSAQTAVDVFRDRWASNLESLMGVSGTGNAHLFTEDLRPAQAAAALGVAGRLDGYTILELGPLEGGHTYLLEDLGAGLITAIEANVEAFLKCLIVKELLNLRRSQFFLGDIEAFLGSRPGRFDLVFCSGVLYHMPDPLRSIALMSGVSDRCFVWSHYYDADRHPIEFRPERRTLDGFEATYWSHTYGDRSSQFWGGNRETASWMERDTLISAYRHFGLSDVSVIAEDRDNPSGPHITFAAQRAI